MAQARPIENASAYDVAVTVVNKQIQWHFARMYTSRQTIAGARERCRGARGAPPPFRVASSQAADGQPDVILGPTATLAGVRPGDTKKFKTRIAIECRKVR